MLYLYGGLSAQNLWLNDLWAHDLLEGEWERLSAPCRAGIGCPPPADGSALLGSATPGTVTRSLGTPAGAWSGTEREWRFVLSSRGWVTEDSARNLRRRTSQPGPAPWCSTPGPGAGSASPSWPLLVVVLAGAAVALRRRRRRP